jgi:acid phosphatase (class A)
MKLPIKAASYRPGLLVTIFALLCFGATAKESALHYLNDALSEEATLLPPPPEPDSPEQAADLDTVRAVYHAAGSNDMAAAYGEKQFSVFNFTPEVGGYFFSNSLPKTAAFFRKVQSDAAVVADAEKELFGRPRPYTVDASLANGKLEKSFSYPSGHSTESMVLALVLVDLVPDKREAILRHARTIGWHRVQIARHYPTDIYAGRVLALAIIRRMKQSQAFNKDFDEAKAEVAAAKN